MEQPLVETRIQFEQEDDAFKASLLACEEGFKVSSCRINQNDVCGIVESVHSDYASARREFQRMKSFLEDVYEEYVGS